MLRAASLEGAVGRQASKEAGSLCDGGRQWGQEAGTGDIVPGTRNGTAEGQGREKMGMGRA